MKEILNFLTFKQKYDYLAPDGSEIRLLAELERGGLAHCTLPVSGISIAVKHKTVDEIWYCLSGQGEIWQARNNESEIKEFKSGDSFTISVGNSFQFKNTGDEPLRILIATMPKWTGKEEAILVDGFWK